MAPPAMASHAAIAASFLAASVSVSAFCMQSVFMGSADIGLADMALVDIVSVDIWSVVIGAADMVSVFISSATDGTTPSDSAAIAVAKRTFLERHCMDCSRLVQ